MTIDHNLSYLSFVPCPVTCPVAKPNDKTTTPFERTSRANSVVFVFLCRPQVEEPVPAVQPAAAQALRPVPAEVPVHRGLPARPMLSGTRQGHLPAAQRIDTAARRPAVHRTGCRRRPVRSAAAAATTAAASISPPTQLRRAHRPCVEGWIAPAPTRVPAPRVDTYTDVA